MRTRDPQARWLRFIRGRRLDRNPLRRTSDRVETVILAGLMTAFLAGAPFAVQAGGSLAHEGAQHLQQAQLATRSHVTATTLEAMPPEGQSRGVDLRHPGRGSQLEHAGPEDGVSARYLSSSAPQRARGWRVWTTAGGKLADPPLTDGQVASLTTLGQASSAHHASWRCSRSRGYWPARSLTGAGTPPGTPTGRPPTPTAGSASSGNAEVRLRGRGGRAPPTCAPSAAARPASWIDWLMRADGPMTRAGHDAVPSCGAVVTRCRRAAPS